MAEATDFRPPEREARIAGSTPAGNLYEALERAAARPRGIALIDRNLACDRRTYAEVRDEADAAARRLRRLGVGPGDVVCLLAPTSHDIISVLFGLWRLGAVAVLLPMPRRESELPHYADEVARRADAGAARLVVTTDLFAGVLARPLAASDRRVVTLAELADTSFDHDLPPGPDAEDTALLQFTSGTTGASRAVVLSHRNVVFNMSDVIAVTGDASDDVGVSWLPLFHDMGLVGMLGGVLGRSDLVLAPTEEYLVRPALWFDAISRFRGTVTAAPQFAYTLAARDLARRPRPLDLRSLRMVINGAEPVDWPALQNLVMAAAPFGLPAEALCPMYGMAEATLAVTVTLPGDPVHVESVSRAGLETKGALLPSADADDEKLVVGCGRPLPSLDVAVVDPSGREVPEGTVGAIWVAGESVMKGYRTASGLAEVDRSGWLDTGDDGVWTAGGLAICGRRKDLVIVNGRNIYPEDYEYMAEQVSGVRRSGVVAFADGIPSAEGVVVLAETVLPPDRAPVVARELFEALRWRLPRAPSEVVILPPGALPRTSSGKRQRQLARERWRSSQFVAWGRTSGRL